MKCSVASRFCLPLMLIFSLMYCFYYLRLSIGVIRPPLTERMTCCKHTTALMFRLYSRYQCNRKVKAEARHLLSVMLAIPSWRGCLDLACQEAMSVTAVLLEDETAALNRTAAGDPTTKVPHSSRFLFPEGWSVATEVRDHSSKTGVRGVQACSIAPLSSVVPRSPFLASLLG